MGAAPPEVKSFLSGQQSEPTSGPPRRDTDTAVPNQPITAAKQAMEQERGQTFTSAAGKPTQPSPTNM
ncbi:NAD(FAD)-utilizing dehydrogenase isoform B [Micractinium conductrix]|nr:NAD(FAD)-utilizing dehydrogenase isoform B [Micractinium conductrix]|eukprot:PSC70076.1 NAD(FAD)-utilizing dehydrogenase isoform B [Micractinium conductrix]